MNVNMTQLLWMISERDMNAFWVIDSAIVLWPDFYFIYIVIHIRVL